ncbi:BadF/BadG/BcrA/BcrD ATPase family protein [Deinococcus deserti]|uniref:Putative N-acetylglucosamine kinase n=1 Tax=Deinococcus deserti (strain DSM 17065 / CIP 109153 / LMG 22923 / VCD115) TaxID=546414 RepID=C1D2P1_DEIDV|nr:BadF/BadG/BcrA/BcrD ATPase family protein [Deinococcus deserti]ACO47680.1 putative N-acetylglucosamine kinase [Deinococcus deserti VCD115]
MTRSPLLLGVDAGGTATGWALVRGSQVVATGTSPAFTALLLGTPAGAESLQALATALPGRPDAVQAGIPGVTAHTDAARHLQAALAEVLNVPAGQVDVEGDLDLAYRAHLAPGTGILLYAGTGSIAYHVAANGETVRAGGRGYRLGDDGGGFSLGRAAMRHLTTQLDLGQMPDSLLAREVAAVTGGLDWETLRSFAYGSPGAAALARLAPAVGRAADAGDPDATHILEDAASSLAELAVRLRTQVGPLPVTATGGALRVSPLFPAALTRALPGVNVQQRNHAEAAARYAARLWTS